MKLLYAEDEPAMAEAVTDILEYHNFSVDTVYNGADALAYAREEHYDGIILDVMMPKMDGFTVLRTLREGGDRTPVLLLTAKSEVEDRIAGLDLGADDYLPKPFAPCSVGGRTISPTFCTAETCPSTHPMPSSPAAIRPSRFRSWNSS